MDIIAAHAEANPDGLAAVCGDSRLTWSELNEKGNRLANALMSEGITESTRVITCGRNSLEHFVVSAANRKSMHVGIPMNYRLSVAEMAYQIADSECAAVFAGPDTVEAIDAAVNSADLPHLKLKVAFSAEPMPEGWVSLDSLLESGSAEPTTVEQSLLGPSMTYTAGTTGNPKGAYRANGTDPAVLFSYVSAFDLAGGDMHLVAGPLYHSAPAAFSAINVAIGGAAVLMPHFDPAEALNLIERHKVTTTFMAPTLLQRIVDLPEETRSRFDLSSMRTIICAGAPCPDDVKQRIHDLFGGVLYEFYGASETGVNTLLRPEETLTKPGSCGRPLEGCEIRILDDDGKPVPTGEPGEVWVKAASLITGYYNRDDATAESVKDGFFTVGDIGYVDDEGFLYICDRKRDMIISGGANIYCAEVENAIHSHPSVADVAVIGIPDPEFGESVHALVQPIDGAEITESEIIRWTSELIAPYKKPKSVEFTHLPRDTAGKIRKRELREPYWAGHTKRV